MTIYPYETRRERTLVVGLSAWITICPPSGYVTACYSTLAEAVRWFRNGDHSAVKPWGNPDSRMPCTSCGYPMNQHGWFGELFARPERCHVCPGDWIITHADGEQSLCSDSTAGAHRRSRTN